MAEYIMCQTNSLNEEGEPIVYPHMKLCGMCDMKQFAESIENGTTFTAAEVKGLLDTISSKLAYWMSNGYSVKLDGIGVFTPALGFKNGKSAETSDKERMNALELILTPRSGFALNASPVLILYKSYTPEFM